MKFIITTIFVLLTLTVISAQTVFGDQVNATKNAFACVNFSGESQEPIVGIQAGFSWDPALLTFVSLTPSSRMKDVKTNLDFIQQGELRTVYLQEFQDSGIDIFNYQICFQVIGESGQTAEVNIIDTNEFPFEVTVLDSSGPNGVSEIEFEKEISFINITENQDDCVTLNSPMECLDNYSTIVEGDGELILFVEDLLINRNPNSVYNLFVNDLPNINGTGFIKLNCNNLQDSILELSIQNICNGDVCTVTVTVIDYNNVCVNDAEVSDDEISLQLRPAPINSFNFGKILINGTAAVEYYGGVYGLPKSALMQNNNVVEFQPFSDNQLFGLSTLDEVLLIKHLLGIELLSGWQIVAADIDQSGDLSFTRDFVTHRQLILGVIQNLPGDNYFIAPRDNPIPDNIDGFNYTSDYKSFSFNRDDIDEEEGLVVDVYKYGDVNDNFSVNPRSKESIVIEAEDVYLEAGKEYTIPVRLKDADNVEDYYGLQFSVAGNNITNLVMGSHNFGDKLQTYNPIHSQLNISLVSEVLLNDFEFELVIQAKSSGRLSNILKLNQAFATEYVNESLDLFEVKLEFYKLGQDNLNQESQMQVFPNPVLNELTIQLSPEMIGNTLELFNTLGQVQYRKIVDDQTVVISRDELGSAGLKYIRVGENIVQEVIILN